MEGALNHQRKSLEAQYLVSPLIPFVAVNKAGFYYSSPSGGCDSRQQFAPLQAVEEEQHVEAKAAQKDKRTEPTISEEQLFLLSTLTKPSKGQLHMQCHLWAQKLSPRFAPFQGQGHPQLALTSDYMLEASQQPEIPLYVSPQAGMTHAMLWRAWMQKGQGRFCTASLLL